MAWDGYDQEQSNLGVAIGVLFFGMLFAIWVIVVIGFWGYLLVGLFIWVGILGLKEPSRASAINEKRKSLQPTAHEILKKEYTIWRQQGVTLFRSTLERLASEQAVSWKQIIEWPENHSPRIGKDDSFVKPIFFEPKRVA